MKLVFRTLFFHFFCIILFAVIYGILVDGFHTEHRGEKSIIDFILLSTTIQCGVGISDYYPISFFPKLAVILQQLIMISTHIFTLYIFTV
jgi:hypothetical protein